MFSHSMDSERETKPAMEAVHAFVWGLRVSICRGVILRRGCAGGIAAVLGAFEQTKDGHGEKKGSWALIYGSHWLVGVSGDNVGIRG